MLIFDMRKFLTILMFFAIIISPSYLFAIENNLYAYSANEISGEKINFSKFQGQVVLVVNISTKCGTTHQLADLEKLYNKFKDQGFVILGFPSDAFGVMDTKSPKEIQTFCKNKFGVSFPIFENIEILGPNKHAFFNFLTNSDEEALKGEITFNFEKFLINRKGQLVKRYGSFSTPMCMQLLEDITQELAR